MVVAATYRVAAKDFLGRVFVFLPFSRPAAPLLQCCSQRTHTCYT